MSHDASDKTTARDAHPIGEGNDQGLGSVAERAIQQLKDEERTRCEIWTRVMGYHRPTRLFNPGKRQEHADRRLFLEPGFGAARDLKPQWNIKLESKEPEPRWLVKQIMAARKSMAQLPEWMRKQARWEGGG